MTTLTEKETQMLVAFIAAGVDVNGADSAEELQQDNMTWMSATDLCGALGWNKQEVGGVMSALDTKGLIGDSQESARGARDTDWTATSAGIDLGFPLYLATLQTVPGM